jgi:hypothetical protein
VRFYTLKHSAGRLEITRDENKMKNAFPTKKTETPA